MTCAVVTAGPDSSGITFTRAPAAEIRMNKGKEIQQMPWILI
jgi:hypothetical protein